ncbi:MAG: hypothetical protein E4H20_07415 [Spirochaetales bacterium]|nr:MAG: hypothetical protein E4H20_07415 [Spirochaetales bacterium]
MIDHKIIGDYATDEKVPLLVQGDVCIQAQKASCVPMKKPELIRTQSLFHRIPAYAPWLVVLEP